MNSENSVDSSKLNVSVFQMQDGTQLKTKDANLKTKKLEL